MIPKAQPKDSQPRDVIKRMHTLNVEMSRIAKTAAHGIGTDGMEIILENLTRILAADFKDLENLEMPIAVIKQTNLFASVAISRILWDMYKVEQVTGHKIEGISLAEETKEPSS